MTVEQFEAMVEELGGRCPGCLQVKPLVPDHDHETGQFRGPLCRKCNSAQGFVGDDPAVLRRLADLLEAASCRL